mmetsp:Transcript_6666/g.7431  ORF Transcript_6666/g.7431 Transcript_6666/m.7431 type:complete len:197 (-) Transcript_6666:65-655(-)
MSSENQKVEKATETVTEPSDVPRLTFMQYYNNYMDIKYYLRSIVEESAETQEEHFTVIGVQSELIKAERKGIMVVGMGSLSVLALAIMKIKYILVKVPLVFGSAFFLSRFPIWAGDAGILWTMPRIMNELNMGEKYYLGRRTNEFLRTVVIKERLLQEDRDARRAKMTILEKIQDVYHESYVGKYRDWERRQGGIE